MRGQNNAALLRIVSDDIARDQVVTTFTRLVADQNAIRIVHDGVPGNDRAHRANQVQSTATIPALVCFIRRLALACRTRPEGVRDGVVVLNVIVADRGVRSIQQQYSLIQGILDRESSYGHVVQAGIVQAVERPHLEDS